MQIWNLPHHPRAWHRLKHKSPWFYPLHAPCTQSASVYTHPIHNQPACTHTLYTDNPRGHQKIRFSVNPRLLPSRFPHCRNFDASMRSSSHSLPQNRSSIMLKRSTPIRFSHKKLSINTPRDITKKLSIDPQKGFSPNIIYKRSQLLIYTFIFQVS